VLFASDAQKWFVKDLHPLKPSTLPLNLTIVTKLVREPHGKQAKGSREQGKQANKELFQGTLNILGTTVSRDLISSWDNSDVFFLPAQAKQNLNRVGLIVDVC
jgi:hypothetical protein